MTNLQLENFRDLFGEDASKIFVAHDWRDEWLQMLTDAPLSSDGLLPFRA
jgi:hypothetical protein